MVKDIMDGSAQESFLHIQDIAQNSKAERVRFQANKWVAGVGGISPVQNQHLHAHTFAGFDYSANEEDEDDTVEHTTH